MKIKVKIKLVILDADRDYRERLADAFHKHYSDEIELYSFSDKEAALNTIDSTRVDLLLANEAFDIDVDAIPKRCAFAYFTDSSNIYEFNEQRAIPKYLKTDLIFRQILDICSEKTSIELDVPTGECAVIAFTSAGSGTGTSSEAAACALRFASRGQKVLYLNLEHFASTDLFFSGEGQYTMSDVILAMKKRKANLAVKLDNCVRKDPRGVYFFAAAKNVLDRLALTSEEIMELVTELKKHGGYDRIILDVEFALSKERLLLFRQAQALILVGDGSDVSNLKTEQAYLALEILDSDYKVSLIERIYFLYNRVSSQHGMSVNLNNLRTLGGSPRFSGGNASQIVEMLARQDLFDKLV